MEYCYLPFGSPQTAPAPFGQLSELLYCGYLGQTFGPHLAKRHICHNLLDYIEDDEDLVVRQHLLRPDLSYPGLPGTFSVAQNLYSHLRCNSVGTDGSYRIILDCYVADRTARVIPQDLFAPYAGLPRSRAELQNTSLVPPIFFIQADHSVGLPLGVAKSVADARTPSLLYDSWSPMEGKASIKLRIAVRYLLVAYHSHSLVSLCSGTATIRGKRKSSCEIVERNPLCSRGWCNLLPVGWNVFCRSVRVIPQTHASLNSQLA